MNRRYLLDTNVVSHIMQGRDADLMARLTQLPVGRAVLSSITLAELEYGLHRKGQPQRLRRLEGASGEDAQGKNAAPTSCAWC